MSIDVLPLLSFVVATTFSPGPNNLSAAALGIQHGYRRTLGYLLGITSGFFVVMFGCAVISSQLLTLLPTLEYYLGYVGAAYILWLTFGVITSDMSANDSASLKGAYAKGFLLQLVNPKAIIYGLTLYSGFLGSLAGQSWWLVLSAAVFCGVTFSAISLWALFGAVAREGLKDAKVKVRIKWLLCALLCYTALNLINVI